MSLRSAQEQARARGFVVEHNEEGVIGFELDRGRWRRADGSGGGDDVDGSDGGGFCTFFVDGEEGFVNPPG